MERIQFPETYEWEGVQYKTLDDAIAAQTEQVPEINDITKAWIIHMSASMSMQRSAVIFNKLGKKVYEHKKGLEDMITDAHKNLQDETLNSFQRVAEDFDLHLRKITALEEENRTLKADLDVLNKNLHNASAAFTNLTHKLDGAIAAQLQTQSELAQLKNQGTQTTQAAPAGGAPILSWGTTAVPASTSTATIPTQLSPHTSPRLRMPAPNDFEGNTKDIRFENWRTDMGLYLHASGYTDEQDKIAVTIIKLKGHPQDFIVEEAALVISCKYPYTWEFFMDKLATAYKTADMQKEAQAKIEAADKANHKTVADYVTAITPYIAALGFQDADLIHCAEKKLSHDLKVVTTASDKPPPTSFHAWKDWIIGKENILRVNTGKLSGSTTSTAKTSSKDPNAMDIDAMRNKEIKYDQLVRKQIPWAKDDKCLKCRQEPRPGYKQGCKQGKNSPYYGQRFDIKDVKYVKENSKLPPWYTDTSKIRAATSQEVESAAISPEVLAEAMRLVKEREEGISTVKTATDFLKDL